jgi:hypothetical protein
MILHLPYLPFNFDGLALRWVILVKKGQDSIIPHEMVHIEQQKRVGFFKYMFKYLTNCDFRVKMEYEAYFYGSGMDLIWAVNMAEKYRDTLTPFKRL